jgi:hypothetical protein
MLANVSIILESPYCGGIQKVKHVALLLQGVAMIANDNIT